MEADLIGQYGYACLITPYRWKVTNTSLTVIQLQNDSATPPVEFVDATPESTGTTGIDMAALLDRYRQPMAGTYWLQPGDTVEVRWSAGPGQLAYHADPAESAGRTLAVHGLESLATLGRRAHPSDVADCVEGVAGAVRDTSQLTRDTWNKVVTNGLTVSGCAELVDEPSDASMKERLKSTAGRVWSQVEALVRSPQTVIRYSPR